MNEFKAMARILNAVKECDHRRHLDMSLFQPGVIKVDESIRDSLIVKLQKDGYIDGFHIIDDIDNQEYPYIIWSNSLPSITIKGMTFIQENAPLKKAIKEIGNTALEAAKIKITNNFFIF